MLKVVSGSRVHGGARVDGSVPGLGRVRGVVAVLLAFCAVLFGLPADGAAQEPGQLAIPDVDVKPVFVGEEIVVFGWEPVENALGYEFEATQRLLAMNLSGDTFYTLKTTTPEPFVTMDFYRGTQVCVRVRAKPANNNGIYSTSSWSERVCTVQISVEADFMMHLNDVYLELLAAGYRFWWADAYLVSENDPRAASIGDVCVAVVGDSGTRKLCGSEADIDALIASWIEDGGGGDSTETIWLGGSDDTVVAP